MMRRMRLSPHEQDRLMIALAAMVAHDRLARGVRLNYPEAVAIISASCWKARATAAPSPS
ncbi:MAG: urease subunit gamma/beta [Acidimicrobiaceae bacterium]|jgi:urease gamma subunit|nr:urease subunit gamma/beta [Acidimicrobiaceae bacterium]